MKKGILHLITGGNAMNSNFLLSSLLILTLIALSACATSDKTANEVREQEVVKSEKDQLSQYFKTKNNSRY
jgi:outer membrane biogenesis lipoprotein LolB